MFSLPRVYTVHQTGYGATHHCEAFDFWNQLIKSEQLTTPFEVVHIDAHSDLGYPPDSSYAYTLTELTKTPLEQRVTKILDDNVLGIANYLLLAAACGWFNKMTYVLHPTINFPRDLHGDYFKDGTVESGFLQLKQFQKETLLQFDKKIPDALEPEILFTVTPKNGYRNIEPFSFVVLSHSPNYTPKKADKLIKVIMGYINEI